jgi:hypothetical protein
VEPLKRRLRILAPFLLALLAALADAQTPVPIPIAGNLGTIAGTPAPDSYVTLTLQNCSGGTPKVTGYQGIVQTTYQFVADVNGNVNGTIWPNDVITCGLTTGSTQYALTVVSNDVPIGQTQCYSVTSTQLQWNLNTQQPVSCSPTPPNPNNLTTANLDVTGTISGGTANLGGALPANHLNFTNLGPMPAAWTFDYTTQQSAMDSLSNGGATTATFNTASSKISPVRSVQAWGAVCDGVTDDSAAILAAVASSNVSTSNSGAAISFPSIGLCRVTQPIIVTTDNLIQILGTGPNSGLLCDFGTWTDTDYSCLEYRGTSGHYSVGQTFANFTINGENNSSVVSTGFNIYHSLDHNGGVYKIVGLNVDNVRAVGFDTGFSISDVTESNFRHLSAVSTRRGYAILGQNVNDTFDGLIFDSATNAFTSSIVITKGIVLDGKTYPDTTFNGPEGINILNSMILGAATNLTIGQVLQANIEKNILDLATGDAVVMGQADGCPNSVNFTDNWVYTTGAGSSLLLISAPSTCSGLNVTGNHLLGSSTTTGQYGINFGPGLNWSGMHIDRNTISGIQHPVLLASSPSYSSVSGNWSTSSGDTFINGTASGSCGTLTVDGNKSTINQDIVDLTCTGAVMGTNYSPAQTTGPYFPGAATFAAGFQFASGQVLTAVQGSTGTKVLAASGTFTNTHLVSIDSNGDAADAGIASTAVPTVATPTAGHAACIKSAGPPVLIGYCSTQPDASGNCTCN